VNTQTSASATGPHLARLARWWRCAIGPKTAPLLACGLGALSVLAFAPFHYSPLLLLTLAGLFAVWRGQSVRAAALSGFSFGLGLFGAGVSWVYVSLHTYGGMPAVFAAASTLLFCAYLAVYPALAGALFAKLRSHRALFDIPLLAACWTMAEWLRGFVFTGFPWLNVGYSQTPPSPLAGFAPVLDGRHYFDYHHTAADTLDKVNPENLRSEIAVMAVLAYFLAETPDPLPRARVQDEE
jgi:apolipoprotein N-acyltransferase